jgi:Archaeal fructose-1,6-bisphosphatase and related enzymes of inositol monophosphatase family
MINNILEQIRQAGNIMLSADYHENNNLHSKTGTANFVTEYDVKVQDFLYKSLAEIIPDANFIGEESDVNNTDKLKQGYSFIIDPIDGTTNFIHNYGHSCVSVALLKDGEVVFGAVYNPYRDELFHAEKNKGAYLNNKRVNASSRKLQDGLVCFGTSPYYRHLADNTFDLLKRLYLNSRDIRRSGSAALDLCYVACGRCDVFFEMILSPWDYAAGSLIITEAGGLITAMSGDPVTLDVASSVLAANKSAYDDFMKLL